MTAPVPNTSPQCLSCKREVYVMQIGGAGARVLKEFQPEGNILGKRMGKEIVLATRKIAIAEISQCFQIA